MPLLDASETVYGSGGSDAGGTPYSMAQGRAPGSENWTDQYAFKDWIDRASRQSFWSAQHPAPAGVSSRLKLCVVADVRTKENRWHCVAEAPLVTG